LAGEQLFAVNSVDSVTINQIVGAADVAKGSFYNHFADKEAFADAVYELIQGDIEFHVSAANQDVADGAPRVARAMCTVIAYAKAHPDRLSATLILARRTSTADPLNAGLAADIQQGIEQGTMQHIDVANGLIVVIGLIRAAVAHAMSCDRHRAIKVLAVDLSAATLRALGVAPEPAQHIAAQAAHEILGDT
jgi:AcrR family transcriptional regulator